MRAGSERELRDVASGSSQNVGVESAGQSRKAFMAAGELNRRNDALGPFGQGHRTASFQPQLQ